MEVATVDCMIDEGTRTWNAEMVNEIFAPQEAEEIKNIPLAREATEESLYWPWEHDGRFSCKSGYRFLKEDEDVLQLRDRCKEDNEDVVHAVWSCKELDGVWGMNNIWSLRNQQRFTSFSKLMAWVFQHQRNPDLFAFSIWSIWHQRNQVRTQQAYCPLNQLSQLVHDRYAEYKAFKPPPFPSRQKRRAWWKSPDQDIFKINFDGVIYAEEKCSGLGVIIRNQEGLVIASMSTRVPQQLQPIEIEALVASRALEFAREVGISEAVLEGDSLLVIKALETKDAKLAPFYLLIQDSIKLSSSFSKLSYSYSKREGNLVAHSVA
ncbi:uncharacterized protein LOC142620559 [Castanea sativa]|uniref:uncharacterized protein LOC142620559 n=1 Tax=Castanea sativa TaxID=21020 RepID=UPI003F64FBD1